MSAPVLAGIGKVQKTLNTPVLAGIGQVQETLNTPVLAGIGQVQETLNTYVRQDEAQRAFIFTLGVDSGALLEDWLQDAGNLSAFQTMTHSGGPMTAVAASGSALDAVFASPTARIAIFDSAVASQVLLDNNREKLSKYAEIISADMISNQLTLGAGGRVFILRCEGVGTNSDYYWNFYNQQHGYNWTNTSSTTPSGELNTNVYIPINPAEYDTNNSESATKQVELIYMY